MSLGSDETNGLTETMNLGKDETIFAFVLVITPLALTITCPDSSFISFVVLLPAKSK